MLNTLNCGGKILDLSQPQVMGILNVTPDSFSDGGIFLSVESALTQARCMVDEGAAIIDVGGESTRPGATAVTSWQEMDRVLPVIEAIHRELPVIVSIDTSKPEVMRAAVAAGAGMINDVRALREEGALQAALRCDVPVCLMHMQGEPRSMQKMPQYEDVVAEVKAFLAQRIAVCVAAGIPREYLMVDPGFGFGKALRHNLRLFKYLNTFYDLGLPMLVGVSRKSMIGVALGDPLEQRLRSSVERLRPIEPQLRPVEQRLPASIALAALAVWQGAVIIRAHDVQATVDAVKMMWLVKQEN